jgi:hypothetical protein
MVLAGLDNCDAYIDDAIIYSDTFSDHLQTIRAFFDRLTDAKLTINLEKSELRHATLTYLGQLMRFLGMAGYHRKFCKKNVQLLLNL